MKTELLLIQGNCVALYRGRKQMAVFEVTEFSKSTLDYIRSGDYT